MPQLIHIKGQPIRGSTVYPLDLPEKNMVRVRASRAAESFQRYIYIHISLYCLTCIVCGQ